MFKTNSDKEQSILNNPMNPKNPGSDSVFTGTALYALIFGLKFSMGALSNAESGLN